MKQGLYSFVLLSCALQFTLGEVQLVDNYQGLQAAVRNASVDTIILRQHIPVAVPFVIQTGPKAIVVRIISTYTVLHIFTVP
jgi:hypothetical protein